MLQNSEHGHNEEPIELIDLEEWAKAGKTPKPAKIYRIRIDKDKKDVTVAVHDGPRNPPPREQDARDTHALAEDPRRRAAADRRGHDGALRHARHRAVPDAAARSHGRMT